MVWNRYVVQNWYNGLKKVHDALNLRKYIQRSFQNDIKPGRMETDNSNEWKWMKIIQEQEQNSSKVVKIGPKRNKQIWAIESASQLKKNISII